MTVEFSEIGVARTRLHGVLRATPSQLLAGVSRLAGREIWAKPEHLQRTGSFKIRGAYNHLAHLLEQGRAERVVAASAGNHAQGVALAASLLGLQSRIYMPLGIALPKLAATRDYGAEVVLVGESVEECLAEAAAYAASSGAHLVPPFDDAQVIAGQGTIGLEIAEELPRAASVVVPVGGGGLLAGIALALRHVAPGIRVIGVEAAGAAPMAASLKAGERTSIGRAVTMADGIALKSVGELCFEIARDLEVEVVTVEEEEIADALLVLAERSKWIVEPAGAVSLAAVLHYKVPDQGPVLVVASGGNVDPLLLVRVLEYSLAATGRYLRLRIVLDDRPGSLAALTSSLAALGLNVLGVEHHRAGAHLAPREVEVALTVETRDPEHADRVLAQLVEAGFRAEFLPAVDRTSPPSGARG